MPRERALATAFRLLDLGFFRIGGEAYAEANNSYGLATVRKEHVTMQGGSVIFEYTAKSGQERYVALADDLVAASVRELLRRGRGGGPELLAYKESGRWHDVSSADINDYIKDKVGGEVSAKDFRTWHGTVIAEVVLAAANEKARTQAARRRAVSSAMKNVSLYLGNTPAVARKSYVDPRVIDLFNDGVTISPALADLDTDLFDGVTHGKIETAVLNLLQAPKSQLKAAAVAFLALRRRTEPKTVLADRGQPGLFLSVRRRGSGRRRGRVDVALHRGARIPEGVHDTLGLLFGLAGEFLGFALGLQAPVVRRVADGGLELALEFFSLVADSHEYLLVPGTDGPHGCRSDTPPPCLRR